MTDVPKPARLRLNKALAQAGVCSRRQADAMILAGRVAVNGAAVAVPGTTVDPLADCIAVDGKTLAAPGAATELVIILNKPPMVVTTAKDPQKRQTVLDLVPQRFGRLFPVGRLDFFSEGLILLTGDGDLAYRLTHPKWHLPKVYRVLVRGTLSPDKQKLVRSGMTLAEGERLAPMKLTVSPGQQGQLWLTLTLIQGINRQIRRMCRDLDLTVLRLIRVAQGPVALGDLKKGAWRELSPPEVKALRAAVGLPEQA